MQGLYHGDLQRRRDFCQEMLERIQNDGRFHLNILWTDESNFNNCGKFNRRNTHIWRTENPREIAETNQQRRFSVNVWCGLLGNSIIGPYFYEGTLTADRYLAFLREELPGLLEDIPLRARYNIVYQHDGAPPHNRRDISAFLDINYKTWIGNKANRERGHILWPARSADLTPLDFWLWGSIKDEVYSVRSNTPEQLRGRISAAFNNITQEKIDNVHRNVVNRLRLCLQHNGGHFEQYM